MASAEKIKAPLKSHTDADEERFFSVATQVAAHEAGVAHGNLAVELPALVDRAKNAHSTRRPVGAAGSAGPCSWTSVQSAWPNRNENRKGAIFLTSTKMTALP